MIRSSGSATRTALAVIVLAIVGMCAWPSAGWAADDDGNLTVEVTDGSTVPPTSSPAPAGSTGSSGTGSAGSSARGSTGGGASSDPAVDQATVTPSGADGALGDDALVVDGVYAISGLSASVAPNLLPINGSMTLSFTVRNTSLSAFDAWSEIEIRNLFDAKLKRMPDVAVAGLQPGETRRVMVRVDGLGQWTFVKASMRFVPPDTVGDVPVTPVTRDAFLFFPPVFALALTGVLALAAAVAWWWVRKLSAVVPPVAAGAAA